VRFVALGNFLRLAALRIFSRSVGLCTFSSDSAGISLIAEFDERNPRTGDG